MRALQAELAVLRFEPDAAVPAGLDGGEFFSLTRTPTELSIICDAACVPPPLAPDDRWRALYFDGVLNFELVGVLARVSAPLAQAGVSILAVCTHDTDYVLVPSPRVREAAQRLRAAGFEVEGTPGVFC